MNRKEQIVNQAIKLFAQNCYRKVTMKTIARKCHITEAALYKHFSSKDELYDAVLKSIRDKVSPDEFLNSLKSELNIETLLTSLARFIAFTYSEHKQILRLLLYSSLEEHTMAKEIFHSSRLPYIKFLAGKLTGLIKNETIAKINPQITARCFIGMVFDCVMNSMLWKGMAGREYTHETILKNNISIFARGLTTEN